MIRACLALAALIAPSAAIAHPGHGAETAPFAAGLLHPLTGADHLLAMTAVGLWAAIAGGAALAAYPGSFLAAMIAGAFLAVAGVHLPAVEPAILASVIVLGALCAAALRAPLPLACGLVALFGLAHGHAHGLEGPAGGGALYGLGFVAATAALHGAGVLVGREAGRLAAAAPRALGGLAAAAGLVLLAG